MTSYDGLVCASASPFTASGNVDIAAIERLVEYYVQNNFSGAFFMSSTGEYFSSSPEKRRLTVSTAALCAKGRLTIYGGVSEDYIEGIYENIDAMQKAGADAVMLMPPRFLVYSQPELIQYYTMAADYSPLPLFIYSHMTRLPNRLDVASVETLSHHPNIFGIKDTHNDHTRLLNMVRAVGGRDDFTLFSGGDGIAGLTCLLGGNLLNALSPVCPKLFHDMIAAGKRQDVATVMALQEKTNRLMKLFTAVGDGKIPGNSPFTQGVKAALREKGLCDVYLSQLGVEVTDEDTARVRAILSELESEN